MRKKPAAISTRWQAEAQQFVTAMLRATTIAKPIIVAAPVIEIMHEAIATPVIVPVAQAIAAQPNLLMRFFPWIDDTYSNNWKAMANDNTALTVTKAA